jgi:Ricin-type beta-trefoil lectin domain/Putative Ig domain
VNLRGLLLGGATAAAVALAGPLTMVATAGSAGAATMPVANSGPVLPSLRHANLHAAFDQAPTASRMGHIGGVVPPRGAKVHGAQTRASVGAAQPAVTCTEPNCNVTYNGGPVQHSPHVYLVLWGPNWSNSSPAFQYLAAFFAGLGAWPNDNWSTITSQYGDNSGTPAFGSSVFESADTLQDSSTPPNPVTENDLASEAAGAASYLGVKDLADAQFVVVSQSGTCFNDGFIGNSASCPALPAGVTPNYCSWHGMTTNGVAVINLPYALDAGAACGENWINAGAAGIYDGFSTLAGHEYAETISDPNPPTGWIDTADPSGGEIGDKCAWGGTTGSDGDLTLSTGTFAVQGLWSNAAGACVMVGPSLTISNPGTQAGKLGAGVNLSVSASSSPSSTLSFSATGLPDGLTMNAATGNITGTPSTTAGTWHPTVNVSDGSQTGHVTFAWQVSSTAGGVHGYARKCLDDYLGHTANGTKVDLWSCNGLPRERVTFQANGELQLKGKCVTARSGVAVLESCTGSATQTWTHRANSEYAVRVSGRCLTIPGTSTANGTQLRLQACASAPRQKWSLP